MYKETLKPLLCPFESFLGHFSNIESDNLASFLAKKQVLQTLPAGTAECDI